MDEALRNIKKGPDLVTKLWPSDSNKYAFRSLYLFYNNQNAAQDSEPNLQVLRRLLHNVLTKQPCNQTPFIFTRIS